MEASGDGGGGDGTAERSPMVLVLVPGFLGGGDGYWALDALRKYHPGARFVATSPGPVSSHHDRACEIFAQLRGGRVDYGEAHAAACAHARWGATYVDGLHPHWSAAHPVHLIGHSIGGITARALHSLLEADAWGVGSDEGWVRSITALSTPMMGDAIVYRLGARADLDRRGDVRAGSLGWALTLSLHVWSWVDIPCEWIGRFFPWPLDALLSIHRSLAHWDLSRTNGLAALAKLIRTFKWKASIGQGVDNAAFEARRPIFPPSSSQCEHASHPHRIHLNPTSNPNLTQI